MGGTEEVLRYRAEGLWGGEVVGPEGMQGENWALEWGLLILPWRPPPRGPPPPFGTVPVPLPVCRRPLQSLLQARKSPCPATPPQLLQLPSPWTPKPALRLPSLASPPWPCTPRLAPPPSTPCTPPAPLSTTPQVSTAGETGTLPIPWEARWPGDTPSAPPAAPPPYVPAQPSYPGA